MNLIQVETYDDLSQRAADMICAVVAAKANAALVLATGDTPMGAYQALVTRHAQGRFDASQLHAFQLDAYLGLGPDDPRSLYGWLARSFVEPLHVPAAHVWRLPGDTLDPAQVCADYDAAVATVGGFDLSILGLGPNGHLGFNEPPSTVDLPTRIVQLTEASLESNARYWGGRDQVPLRAITCGMRQLLAAQQTILLVSGTRKRDILYQTLYGPVTPEVPASLLRLAPNVTVIADHDALPSCLI